MNKVFSVQETADILGVSHQTVYSAIGRGSLRASTNNKDTYQITPKAILDYAVKVGRNPKSSIDPGLVADKVQKRAGTSSKQLLEWILLGLGLFWVYKMAIREEFDESKREER